MNIFSLVGATFILVILSDILGQSLASEISETPSSVTDRRINSSWYEARRMPTPRSEIAGVIMDGKVYVVGGFVLPENSIIPGKSNTVEVYDIKNNSWYSTEPLPQKLDHVGAAEYNGKLYVVGGSFGSENNRSNKLFIYDHVSNKWKEGKPMPTARSALTAVFIEGILYAIGGQDHTGSPLNSTEAYDPKTDSWTIKAPMPTPRHHLTSAGLDGKLYVFGGRTVSNSSSWVNLNSNEMYDPVNDSWTSKAPMPSNRSGLAAAACEDDKIYVFGGEDAISASAMTYDNNEKYDPKNDKWTAENPMPTARHGLAAIFDNITKKIYVIGGGVEAGDSVSNINEILAIN